MVFILFYLLSLEKSSTTPYQGFKKMSLKLGKQGEKKKRNFALISKMSKSVIFGKREKNLQNN
jgi:hypothetical protein